jgi:hypothetical protein
MSQLTLYNAETAVKARPLPQPLAIEWRGWPAIRFSVARATGRCRRAIRRSADIPVCGCWGLSYVFSAKKIRNFEIVQILSM